jgi:hypothetical protein
MAYHQYAQHALALGSCETPDHPEVEQLFNACGCRTKPLLTPTCAAAGLAGPQYTTVLTWPFTCGSAAARLAILSDATNTMVASEWVTMYSMAFSPNESYNGTQYSDMRLHACTTKAQQVVSSRRSAPCEWDNLYHACDRSGLTLLSDRGEHACKTSSQVQAQQLGMLASLGDCSCMQGQAPCRHDLESSNLHGDHPLGAVRAEDAHAALGLQPDMCKGASNCVHLGTRFRI